MDAEEGSYKVADMSLAEKGEESIYVAARKMPVTCKILRERFAAEKPLEGLKIAGCLHVTKETANLALTLKEGGAEVMLCGSNPLSTQDDVAAALVNHGIKVFAWHGNTSEEFYWCIRECLKQSPNILIDDGADMIVTCHKEFHELIDNGTILATDRRRKDLWRSAAQMLMTMVKKQVLPRSIITKDSLDNAKAFARRFGLSYPSMYDGDNSLVLAFAGQLPPSAIPTTLVLDRDGRVAARAIDAVDRSRLLGMIEPVLAEKA